ncbi:formyltransferase [Chromobacterium sphagni]|uniref:Formyltransferase n=1 Tax=Chromobacterium sphagni TaxID=1903179 RepID=A0ABX3CH75_9NEIS|nr:formyltransferase [Chromobacterium sphagni]OHX21302.1 formyltransferase [Chromobacterium sphagni]
MSRAVVFAYHNVGVRCLKALIGRGVDVALVVTHQDNPNENIWFQSVAQTARDYGIPAITPDNPNAPDVVEQVKACQADFLFSFYYRHMLKAPLLEAVNRGAYNMHGSLLPKYRGRVPINWAVIHGETETGATLHQMNVKPDSGPVVDQMAVPILPDDSADEVFAKVTVAAEMVLWRSLPGLIAGAAPHVQQDLSQGAYFGGRKPEDGRIDARAGAAQLHNFVRALTLPFPGAFADTRAGRLLLWKTLQAGRTTPAAAAELYLEAGRLWLRAADGGRLAVLQAELAGQALGAENFAALAGGDALPLSL